MLATYNSIGICLLASLAVLYALVGNDIAIRYAAVAYGSVAIGVTNQTAAVTISRNLGVAHAAAAHICSYCVADKTTRLVSIIEVRVRCNGNHNALCVAVANLSYALSAVACARVLYIACKSTAVVASLDSCALNCHILDRAEAHIAEETCTALSANRKVANCVASAVEVAIECELTALSNRCPHSTAQVDILGEYHALMTIVRAAVYIVSKPRKLRTVAN